jgi:hypothetical protein
VGSWLLTVSLIALVPVACGKVDESANHTFACDQSVASYCAAQLGGCPTSDTPENICLWLTRVGGDQSALRGGPLGYPLTCEELPERKVFSVAVDDSARTYVFARGSLYYVFESKPGARCADSGHRDHRDRFIVITRIGIVIAESERSDVFGWLGRRGWSSSRSEATFSSGVSPTASCA